MTRTMLKGANLSWFYSITHYVAFIAQIKARGHIPSWNFANGFTDVRNWQVENLFWRGVIKKIVEDLGRARENAFHLMCT